MDGVHCYVLPDEQHLRILAIEAGPVATNGYMLMDMNMHSAIIIDAPYQSVNAFCSFAEENGLHITGLWLTHSHWDHTADAEICAEKGWDILIHPDDEYRLLDQSAHTVWPLPFTLGNIIPTGRINHGDILTCGDWNCTVLHTPGHTEGGVCFVDSMHSCAFVGDTLFSGSIGRTDLPGGNTDTLLASIAEQLMKLSDDITVFPGHGPLTTIGEERQNNPFLQ